MMSLPVHFLMKTAVCQNIFPGGVLLVARRGEICYRHAFGLANRVTGTPVTLDTVFDLASLTKPLATTLAVAGLVARKRLCLQDKIAAHLPVFRGTEKASITIEQLLLHRSGYPAHRSYFERLHTVSHDKRPSLLHRFLLREPLAYPPGEQVIYTDLGFMLLAWIVAELTGRRLDDYVRTEVYAPLGIEGLFFNEVKRPHPHPYAATEDCPRRGLLLGTVHDDNAHALGGVAGHAGLFGTADAVYRLVQRLLDIYHGRLEADVLPVHLLRRFLQRRPAESRVLGFDVPSEGGSSSGRLFSPDSVGHLGFTGTSFWMDLPREICVILLTNRVHPARHNTRIRIFRPALHNAVMAGMEKR